MYRSYEILSDFYKKHFVDLRVLDTSCDPVSSRLQDCLKSLIRKKYA